MVATTTRGTRLLPTEKYRIHGSHLELVDATGAVGLRFEAVALD
jgi:hypothetical protein